MASRWSRLTATALRAIFSSKGITVQREAAEINWSANVFLCLLRRIFLTSYRTTVGTRRMIPFSKYGAKRSAFVSLVIYSSHPEESTRTGSETLRVVTIGVLPFHPLRHPSQILDRTRSIHTNCSIQEINL